MNAVVLRRRIHQACVILQKPGMHLLDKILGQFQHFGFGAGDVVHAHAPFPAIPVESVHHIRLPCDGIRNGADNAKMVRITFRNRVSGSRECSRAGLRGDVIGDVESPIVVETFDLRVFEVAIGQAEEVEYFLSAGLMGFEPAVSLPVA